jgi:hypothetical protein
MQVLGLGHLSALIFVTLQDINGFTPGSTLTVIDFAEIEYLLLNNAVIRCSVVLDNAPVSMFFAVFETAFGSKKHVPIVRNTI